MPFWSMPSHNHSSCLRVVNGESATVVSDYDIAFLVAVDGRHEAIIECSVDGCDLIAVQTNDALTQCAYINAPLAVHAYTANRRAQGIVLQVAGHYLSLAALAFRCRVGAFLCSRLPHQHPHSVGDNPNTSLGILSHVVNGAQLSQHTTYLMGLAR